ncbi:hypothetical protein TRVL_04675 [Trypanosoma vivax]|nr:hypothetical protein TRVL_04675 [Trypanosoma vivax]
MAVAINMFVGVGLDGLERIEEVPLSPLHEAAADVQRPQRVTQHVCHLTDRTTSHRHRFRLIHTKLAIVPHLVCSLSRSPLSSGARQKSHSNARASQTRSTGITSPAAFGLFSVLLLCCPDRT